MRSTMTSTLLLEGLRRPDNHTVWQDYVDRYRPLLVRFARRLGVPEADAEDLAQQALCAFADGYRNGAYDRERGRLRAWLFGIARNFVRRWLQRPPRELQAADASAGTGFLERISTEDQIAEIWAAEWRQAVLQQCLLEVSLEVEPRTFRAFEQFARRGLPAREVAAELGISENAVFGAKRRVLRRIRELLPKMEDSW